MKKLVILLVAVTLLLAPTTALAAGKLAIGTQIGYLTLKYQFTDDLAGSVGANSFSWAGASQMGLAAKVDYNLPKLGEVQPSVGIYYTTDGAATATTTLGIAYGIGVMVKDNLSIGADLNLLTSTSWGGGASTTAILPGATINVALYLM